MLIILFRTIIILSGLSLSVSGALAEYRVYQYFVKSLNTGQTDNTSYLVTSSLDPWSYLSYHGGPQALSIDFLRTWMCPGFTGLGKPYCQSPYEKVLETKIKK